MPRFSAHRRPMRGHTLEACALSIALFVLATLVLTVLAGCARSDTSSEAEPTQSAVQRVAYTPDRTQQTIDYWTGHVERAPEGALGFTHLAAAHLARQRETSDIAHAVKAEAAARRALELQPNRNYQALVALTRSLLAQHRFPEARDVAERAAALAPDGYRVLTQVQYEQGDYDAAWASLQQIPKPLQHLERNDLNRQILFAQLLEQAGRDEEAFQIWQDAARRAEALPDMPHETAAWFHVMRCHRLVDGGDLEAGEAACRTALSIFPRDHRALTGLAEAANWRGDTEATIQIAEKALDLVPQNPEVLLLLIGAHEATGDAAAARRYEAQFEALVASFPRIYDRHWVHYAADQGQDLDRALTLARADLDLRQDGGAYAALAHVLHARGDHDAAHEAMQEALTRGAGDPDTFLHAAAIAEARGETADAQQFRARAKSLNPYLR